MSRIGFDTYTPKQFTNYKKLKLEQDEQALVCFLEEAPASVYVHNMNKVKVDENGDPITKIFTYQNGKTREGFEDTWVGTYICLGREEVLNEQGFDAEECPACAAFVWNSTAFEKPKRRFLGNTLVYKTKPHSFDLRKPFSADIVVWNLTAARFEELWKISQLKGDLRKIDLLLGPCKKARTQEFGIMAGNEAEWMQHKEYVNELTESAWVDDLEAIVGKRPSETELSMKVNEIKRAWKHAFGSTESDNVTSILQESTEALARKATEKKKEVVPEDTDEEEDAEDNEPPYVPTNTSTDTNEDSSDDEEEEVDIDDILGKFRRK